MPYVTRGNLVRRPSTTPRHSLESGSTLVEVLVTVVLVSVGLLGLSAMQVATVQTTNSASQRFEATLLARDILERMRANRTQALAGGYDIAIGANPVAGNLADDDLVAWKDALAALPGGDGAVEVDGGVATITVQWTDASDQNAGDTREVAVFLRTDI